MNRYKTIFKYAILIIILFVIIFRFSILEPILPSKDLVLNSNQTLPKYIGTNRIEFQYYSNTTMNNQHILFLGLIQNARSYGVETRGIGEHIEMILKQIDDPQNSCIGFLVSDEEEKAKISRYASEHKLVIGKLVIISQSSSTDLSREERHDNHHQKQRRRNIALLRNELVYSLLSNYKYVLMVDTDITFIPKGLVAKFIKSGKDIITPRCGMPGGWLDYDLNTWKGPRVKPTVDELKSIKAGGLFVPGGAPGRKHAQDFMNSGSEFVQVDSVGGSLLFVKGEIFRKGISFPPLYIIGAEWDMSEGYDGIETEGLCYVARSAGYKCWLMPDEGN